MMRYVWVSWLSGCLLACGDGPGQLGQAHIDRAALTDARPVFQTCSGRLWHNVPGQGFQSPDNQVLSRQPAHHNAEDVIANPNSTAGALGWFAYGMFRHALPSEAVDIYADDCNDWAPVASTHTDPDGMATALFATHGPGLFTMVQEVLGDGSTVTARLHVVPAETHAVVFDVDGTLTVSNSEFVKQVLNPSYVPKAYSDAVHAAQAWADKGYLLIYLTGRPFDAAQVTRAWLNTQGFPPGHLHLAKYLDQLVSDDDGVGQFKLEYLQYLSKLGLRLDYAYGNEPTDLFAYRGAGVPLDHTYMVGPKASTGEVRPLPTGYTEHLPFIQEQAPVLQPFDRP